MEKTTLQTPGTPKKQEKGLFIFASKLPRLFCVYADTGNYRAGLQSDGL